jgi:hypothetical protein
MQLTEHPDGGLGPALLSIWLNGHGTTASLHADGRGRSLWLREVVAEKEALGRVDSVAVTRRSVDGTHFLLAGAFARLRAPADGVIFEDDRKTRHRATTCADGWLLAVPVVAGGRGTLQFTNDGRTVESAELPPLADAGAETPTFYAPIEAD